MNLNKIIVKRFRSINNLEIQFTNGKPLVICGANNVGKTNFLRAMDLYFSLDKNKFDADIDIPYTIAEGSRGAGYNSEIIGDFFDEETGDKYQIKTKFTRKKDEGNILEISGKKNGDSLDQSESISIIKRFRFIFVQSNNIDLPKIIAQIMNENVLANLDKMRKRQTVPLAILQNFFEATKESVKKIESDLTTDFKKFTSNVAGIDTENWECRIVFPEFEYLREAISNMVTFTLFDSNERSMETKGSGIQRIILLTLMKYISDSFTEKVIWGIDEPEVFLQPGLQKVVFNQIKELSRNIDIVITTHSPKFIDLKDVENTYLLSASYEEATYKRRTDQVFIKTSTNLDESKGNMKIENIKKHMGILKNDSWNIVPYNVLVEGEGDKRILSLLAEAFEIEPINILIASGASKMAGYLEYLKENSEELGFVPTVKCIVDHDLEGKMSFDKLKKKALKERKIKIDVTYIERYDQRKENDMEYEIEDFIYPEIVYDAVNLTLKKKKYKIVPHKKFKEKFNKSYEKMGILKFLTSVSQGVNCDKELLNFEDEGLKLFVVKKICEIIETNQNKIKELDLRYPEVKENLKKIYTNSREE